jgi:hypothetical protein
MGVVRAVISRLKTSFVARFHLALENLALRQQLDVLERSGRRPKLRRRDRIFWVLLSAIWPGWRSALVIVKPETVLGWRRQGFRLCRCWKSRSRRPGRPPISEEIRNVPGEHDLGRTSNRVRTSFARLRCRRKDRGQVHGAHTHVAYADMADVSEQPRDRDDGHRCSQGVQLNAS